VATAEEDCLNFQRNARDIAAKMRLNLFRCLMATGDKEAPRSEDVLY
jgi:hypothetical protein